MTRPGYGVTPVFWPLSCVSLASPCLFLPCQALSPPIFLSSCMFCYSIYPCLLLLTCSGLPCLFLPVNLGIILLYHQCQDLPGNNTRFDPRQVTFSSYNVLDQIAANRRSVTLETLHGAVLPGG